MPYYKSWKNVQSRSKQPGVWITALWGQLAEGNWSSEYKERNLLNDEELAQDRAQESSRCGGGCKRS